MAVSATRAAAGYITVVQESRFRLLTDSGQGLLLTLGHQANVQAEDLCGFLDAHTHVLVEYAGEPNTDSSVVYKVRPIRA